MENSASKRSPTLYSALKMHGQNKGTSQISVLKLSIRKAKLRVMERKKNGGKREKGH
jgi:hypothetical protein